MSLTDETEMILTATKAFLNSDSVPQSMHLECSDVRLTKTVCSLGVCLDPAIFPKLQALVYDILSGGRCRKAMLGVCLFPTHFAVHSKTHI